MNQLSLCLLGSPRLEKGGQPVEFDTRKAMALLAYLAVTGEMTSRDTLAALFWGEYDQSSSRAALRRTLSVLNKAVGEGTLEIGRERLGLAPGTSVWFDVSEFHQRLGECVTHGHAAGETCPRCLTPLSEAVGLYRGDFMAGFTLRDSPEFDDWQFFQTETLRRELALALERMSQGYASTGDYESAITQARRRLALDPLHEPAHRQLMQLYAWSGQHAAALRQYQECTRTLDTELGVPPMKETNQLYQAIKEHRNTAPPPEAHLSSLLLRRPGTSSPAPEKGLATVSILPLVGRSQELAALERYYAEIVDDGYFLAIEGEAGIGKTRLAEEFLLRRGGFGITPITARAYPEEAYLAYAPFIEGMRAGLEAARPDWHRSLLEDWIVEAKRLLPELGRLRTRLPEPPSLDSPGAQARFFEGMSQVLLALCGEASPGILFFDDLQWADEASLDLLTYLIRRLRGRRLFVLAAWRGEDLPPEHRLRRLLAEAERSGLGSALRLTRLGSESVRELVGPVAVTLGESPEGLSQRLYEETEGLPFFLAEYLASLPEAATATVEWDLPQGVRAILLSRLEAVSEAGRQLLQTAAVIGRSFDFDALQEASGRSIEETTTTLEELLRRGLIRESRPVQSDVLGQMTYDFSHDKMRSLGYAETSQARRRILHQRVAESLLRHTHTLKEQLRYAGQIAYHYRQSGRSREAAEFSKLAGEHARSLYANAEALAHFQIALALGHPDFTGLEDAIGDLFTLQGHYKAALSSFASAAEYEGARKGDIARLQHKMGNVYHRLGEWAQAEGCFQAAAPGMEGSELARLYADWSRTMRRAGEGNRALETATRALELAEKAGDAPALAQAHNILGMLLRLPAEKAEGDLERAIYHLEQSLALAEKLPDPGARAAALNNLSLAYADHGELERALEYAHQALELCTLQGDRHRQAALHSNLADLYHGMGMDEPSMAHLKQAVVIFSEIGSEEAERPRPEIWKLTEW